MSESKYPTARLSHWRTIDHEESFERTLSDIEEYGWHAMIITGETWSRFAYTVGAHDALGVPELIVVGLTEKTAHTALNLAIKALQSGIDPANGPFRDVVGEVGVEFRTVSREWYQHVMFRTNWYYGGDVVPTLQIVYPDLDGRFQWENDFNDYFMQPLLTADAQQGQREKDFWALNDPTSALFDWKFEDPPHTHAILSRGVQERNEVVVFVAHNRNDATWEFLGESMIVEGESPVTSCLHHPIDKDRSLVELHDLPLGWFATRKGAGKPWHRYREEK